MDIVKMLGAAGLISILVWGACHFLIVTIGVSKGRNIDMGRAGWVALFPAGITFFATILLW